MLGAYSPVTLAVFTAVIVLFLLIDLMSHRKSEAISIKNAAIWSFVWVAVSLAFAGYIGYSYGQEKASLFLAGYFLEKSLSVDNLFVFMAIFSAFAIKDQYQHRVLYYGIIGALLLRLVFIAAGTSLLAFGPWVLLAFGVFVLWTAWQMYRQSGKEDEEITDYADHWSVRMVKKFVPVHPQLSGDSFFVKESGRWHATPLLLCLVCVEVADVMFAFDSVPAVIAITNEPYLVYTSNIFAILGLRSMYFLLAAAKRYLCHLEKAVIAILAFIGIKMIAHTTGIYHMGANASLLVVAGILSIGILASLVFPEKAEVEA